MAKKLSNIARTIIRFPKTNTNAIPLRYEYELKTDGCFYYIYRYCYQNNKLKYVHNYGVNTNKKEMIKRFQKITNDTLSCLEMYENICMAQYI